MRFTSKLMVAGLGGALLAGSAFAADKVAMHVMKVQMPDGTTKQIRYQGDQPPALIATSGHDAPAAQQGMLDPFEEMDRMMAAMQAQSDAMMRQVAMMQAEAAKNGTMPVSMNGAPQGGSSFSYVSSSSSGNGCVQRVEMVSNGSGEPKVTRTSSGDCTGVAPLETPVALQVAPVAPAQKAAPTKVPAPKAKAKAPGRDTI